MVSAARWTQAAGATRRRVVTWTGLAVGGSTGSALLAAACGRATQEAPPAAQPSKGPVTLRLNYRTEQWIVDRAKAFTAANATITVDLAADSGYEKLLVLAAAGDLGDVYWASTGQGSYFELAGTGHAMALDPLIKRDKYDLKQFYAASLEQARLDGRQ
jgi:ABC-type glycerol-3-phosphate transport system substrate-binding protein